MDTNNHAAGDGDRRKSARQRVDSSAVLRATQPQTLAQVLWARVFDVSSGGAGFCTDMPLDIGAVYRIDVCGKQTRATRAEVRRCFPRSDGMYFVGAAFC
jgi:hypothetical protein